MVVGLVGGDVPELIVQPFLGADEVGAVLVEAGFDCGAAVGPGIRGFGAGVAEIESHGDQLQRGRKGGWRQCRGRRGRG